MHRIEVFLKSQFPDARGQGLVKDIADLGINTVSAARVIDVYWLAADLPRQEVEMVCRALLADPVTQDYRYDDAVSAAAETPPGSHLVEVAYNPGVADPAEASILKAIADLGIAGVPAVKTGKKYLLTGELSRQQLEIICSRLLVNPIIQHVARGEQAAFPEKPRYEFRLEKVDITAKPRVLVERFGFSEDEAAVITEYFRKQGSVPTDVELETLAQTWSEHCVHKTFRGKINFHGNVINNLLKSTIMKATRELDLPWCLSVFLDNAGVIAFDDDWALCFKVETHNHPSAVEPYGGVATGIGGVVRDPLGTGLGAKPILNTDVFCFGPPDFPYEKLPRGVLHPRRIFKGVRAGVADYGNRLGIPTLNGAVLFDDRYVANPLVYCGTLGLFPRDRAQQGRQQPGDLVVVVGGRTGRDGIHGVTFASEQLTEASGDTSVSAVQIGNPIVEKKMLDVLLKARDLGLYRRITDCGGGGLSSAVGEMAAETGVRVDLEKVPLKYAGLSYTEIWVSESQERMLLAVPPERADELIKLFADEGVEATVIGEFTDDRRLRLDYTGNRVADLEMGFLHEGWPQIERKAVWDKPQYLELEAAPPPDLGEALLSVLGAWNVCSKEWVIRQYDHEVQGGNVLKPLVGAASDGPGDAAIIRPILDSERGVIVGCGINTRYGDIDPYWMAASAIDEALRQVIAVGGSLERVALLDNFCWGNTGRPEMLGALVQAAQACHDMALVYGTPFISGKDSLNNEFEADGKLIVIPHTLLVSSLGVIEDVSRAVTMDFKRAGDLIYIVGATRNELGGSEYYATRGLVGNRVPMVDPKQAKRQMDCLSQATKQRLVRACHDCSDGGLGVALAEMAFAGGLGASVQLRKVPLAENITRDDFIFFAETNSRFLVEVAPEDREAFEKIMADVPCIAIGEVSDGDTLEVQGLTGNEMSVPISALKEAWQRPLRW
ncbi:MAG: phosphoribosylformylglycinamidine synthase subunit PurL [Chloroflexota bacterium]